MGSVGCAQHHTWCLYIQSMYLCICAKGALCYVSKDTPVEFTSWLCNNERVGSWKELEMLHLTGAEHIHVVKYMLD